MTSSTAHRTRAARWRDAWDPEAWSSKWWAAPLTWLLALALVFAVGAAITRTRLLWGPTAFEQAPAPAELPFAQTYQAARKLYYAPGVAPRRVAIVGNSLVVLGANERVLDEALADVGASVDIVAVFGGRLGAMEILSRHLDPAKWDLVLFAVSASDLLWDPPDVLASHPVRLLRTGWADGPLPVASADARTERWLRTAWRLFRFREFARTVLAERLRGTRVPTGQRAPFRSSREVFAHVYEGGRAEAVEAAYRRWLEVRSFDAYLDYLRIGQADYLGGVAHQVAHYGDPAERGTPRRSLDALLERSAAAPWQTRLLLMPRNPVLAGDAEERFHVPALEDAAARALRARARDFGIATLDLRDAMPAEVFLDFDHLMPDLSGFDARLAQEIRHALED